MGGLGGPGSDPYGGGGAAGPSSDPANNRYVDAKFAPVSGDDLRTKMQSSAPEDAYFAVAKRIPIRMRAGQSIVQRGVALAA